MPSRYTHGLFSNPVLSYSVQILTAIIDTTQRGDIGARPASVSERIVTYSPTLNIPSSHSDYFSVSLRRRFACGATTAVWNDGLRDALAISMVDGGVGWDVSGMEWAYLAFAMGIAQ